MKSHLFHSDQYETVQEQIKEFLNQQEEFLSGSTVNSTRAVGDAIQDILSENFQTILGADLCAKYSSQFARRAMVDLAFEDNGGFYYVVDVKTHRLSTKFNMPNLTSVERLARFYEDDKNYFVVLMVAYNIEGLRAVIDHGPCEICANRIFGLGLSDDWRARLGPDSDRKLEYHYDQPAVFAQEVDDRILRHDA